MRENDEFRDNHPITVLGVPNVVIREAVHVRLAVAVSVAIHIRHEEMCKTPSVALPPNHGGSQKSSGPPSPPAPCTN